MLVDSHCHLDFPEFAGQIDAVVARARQAGVRLMVTIATRPDKFDAAIAIAEQFDEVYCAIGVHPHEVENFPDCTAELLIARARHPKVVAIGETGLDYHYDHSPRELQAHSFVEHIKAARTTGLPLVVHTRAADADSFTILEREMRKGRYTGLIHCFSSDRQFAEKAVSLGLYISISGIVTFKNADPIREAARHVPLDRLLVETDAPYLAPMPLRGRCNEPAFVAHTARHVADCLGMTAEAFIAATGENFLRLFTRAPRPLPR